MELIDAGPLVVGCETACWTSVLIRVLIWREFGVLYNCRYVCTLLHNLGFRFKRPALYRIISMPHGANTGSSRNGPGFCASPSDIKGLILFEDEASFAQWGSLSYTWARRGQQPEVKTVASAKATKCLAPLSMARDACFIRVSRVGLTRKVTKGSCR